MDSNLYRSFEIEIVKSEYKRSKLTLGVLVFGILLVASNYFLLTNEIIAIYGGVGSYFFSVAWLSVLILYELIILRSIKRIIRKGKGMSDAFRVAHLLIEVSFPSFLMLYMVDVKGMLIFIDSPVFLMYFIFIILAVLHLDFKLSALTALVAAVQYGFIVMYGFHFTGIASSLHPVMPENTFYLRCILILIAGVAGGFVAVELRKKIKSTFELQNAKYEIENLFGQQVSKEVLKELVEERGTVKKLEATVLAFDVRDFSVFAEKRTPDEIIDYQNKIFGPVIDIINQHQGVVNQILGDGIMATFGTPVANPLHADMAFQASLTISKKLKQLSDQNIIPETRIGMGLHTGEVITGNIGNENRKQYSISGTAVIIAFRVEQLNKENGSEILITEEVKQRIVPGKAKLIPLGPKPIKGFGKSVEVFQVKG